MKAWSKEHESGWCPYSAVWLEGKSVEKIKENFWKPLGGHLHQLMLKEEAEVETWGAGTFMVN